MAKLLQVNNVEIDKVSSLTFSLAAGEKCVLEVPSAEAAAAVVDLILGERVSVTGEILLLGQSLEISKRGTIGFIPAMGGLISNLKAWENITLPLWYYNGRQRVATEESVARWLLELGMDKEEWGKFMASPAASLKPWERKMAGLLRGLVQAPQLILIDAGLFDEVETARLQLWITVLEKFVGEVKDRALLVIASSATSLPWRKLE